MDRRTFIHIMGGAAVVAMPTYGQQPTVPVIGFLTTRSAEEPAAHTAAFRRGLSETGYVEGQNVAIEYIMAEGSHGRLPGLAADLVDRNVDLIVRMNSSHEEQFAPAASTVLRSA